MLLMLKLTMIVKMFLLMWKYNAIVPFMSEAKHCDNVWMNVPFVPPFTMNIRTSIKVAPCTFGFQPFNGI
jgi:hypothetical protein